MAPGKTAEDNLRFITFIVNTLSNQSVVNNLGTLFGQLLVPRSATGSLVCITSVFDYPSIAACAAANLAIGTRNGEQLT